MFQHFRNLALEAEKPPDKRKIAFEYNGLYYADDTQAERIKRLYGEWKALDYNTRDMFGAAFMDLPPKLRHDLVILKLMDLWHTQNLKAPHSGAMPETFNPFKD